MNKQQQTFDKVRLMINMVVVLVVVVVMILAAAVAAVIPITTVGHERWLVVMLDRVRSSRSIRVLHHGPTSASFSRRWRTRRSNAGVARWRRRPVIHSSPLHFVTTTTTTTTRHRQNKTRWYHTRHWAQDTFFLIFFSFFFLQFRYSRAMECVWERRSNRVCYFCLFVLKRGDWIICQIVDFFYPIACWWWMCWHHTMMSVTASPMILFLVRSEQSSSDTQLVSPFHLPVDTIRKTNKYFANWFIHSTSIGEGKKKWWWNLISKEGGGGEIIRKKNHFCIPTHTPFFKRLLVSPPPPHRQFATWPNGKMKRLNTKHNAT